MSIYSIQPLVLGEVRTYSLASRKSKVNVREFAKPVSTNTSLTKFLDSLPHILAAESLRQLLMAVHAARKQRRAILWGMGGHVIKVGLGPILIDLMDRSFVSGIAMNGAALIHDFEIALAGNTSEDVEAALGEGEFGMAEETGKYLNEIAKLAQRIRIGYGEAAGQFLNSGVIEAKHAESSVLAAAHKRRIPVTVHLAIGTDIPHMHPAADGAALGYATHRDFRLFCALTQQMHPGGVYLNWGSAVLLPEVFLKAVSVVRNLGVPLAPITTANFDFIQHYRPLQNVVKRPTVSERGGRKSTSRGYAITGHHELLMPLVASALAASHQRAATPSRATTNCSCLLSPPRWPQDGPGICDKAIDDTIRRKLISPARPGSARVVFGAGLRRAPAAFGSRRTSSCRGSHQPCSHRSRGSCLTPRKATAAGRSAHLLVLAAFHPLCLFWFFQPDTHPGGLRPLLRSAPPFFQRA